MSGCLAGRTSEPGIALSDMKLRLRTCLELALQVIPGCSFLTFYGKRAGWC